MSGISGRVVNEAGEPVVGVCIFRSPASAPSFQEYVYTAEDGSYFFGAQPGAYKLRFNDAGCGGDSRYAYRWSGNKSTFSDAEVVTVESGQTTDGVDIVLQPGGAISGTVVDNFGRPATSVRVETYDSDGYPAPGFATVDGTGLYTFGGLPTGDYKVYFVGGPQYTPEWYDDKPTRAQADPVHVTQPATTITAGARSRSLDRGPCPSGFTCGIDAVVGTSAALTSLDAHPVLIELRPSLRLFLATLQADLRANGEPVTTRLVSFYVSGRLICAATTDSAGRGVCAGLIPTVDAVLAGGYTAAFAGDIDFVGSSAERETCPNLTDESDDCRSSERTRASELGAQLR